ncbi:pilin [Acinetobacter terrestris]|uniref:pilin n=1 Tax=Acinetobacter terrestris TaxID=2529843 RepID=UPI00103EC2D5|nr:pilin [Acinetobacter terrestris]TCB64494.1 prepilin-type N-terminal cleavage/methylation domain-containing protein [Acinetobacter terrestris]
MNAQKGFTLIELMIVVAIIGILAAIAIPQYQNYVARSNVAAAVSTLSANKTGLEEYVMEYGEFPDGTTKPKEADDTDPDNIIPAVRGERMEDLGINTSTLGKMNLEDIGKATPKAGEGIIRLQFQQGNPGVRGKVVQMYRSENGAWVCETNIDAKFASKSCPTVTTLKGTAPPVVAS